MKFDKAMEIAYKILAVCTCLALVLGVVSCSKYYINASAVEITAEEKAGIDDYLQAYSENQAAIDFRLDDDSDGNRSVRLQIFGLQQLALQTQTNIYDNIDLSIAPDTVSVSGSSYSGFYEYQGVTKVGTLYFPMTSTSGTISTSATLYSCPDFTVSYDMTPNTSNPCQGFYSSGNDTYSYHLSFGIANHAYLKGNIRYNYSGSFPLSYGSSLFFNNVESNTIRFWVGGSRIPILKNTTRVFDTNNYTADTILGSGTTVELPPGSSDTSRPWDYYNDTLLPYLRDNYPTYNEYFVFPDGYEPQQDPTEPPNIDPNKPGGGVPIIAPIIVGSGNIINVDGIDFHIYAPIKGQLEIDGITFQFPGDGSNDLYIDRTPYKIPLPEFEYKNHDIEIPDISHIIFDGVTFNINPDGSLTINNDNYPLPIGQPETVSSNDDYLVYKYEIPTVENINIVDAELSAPDLSGFADGITFISGATMDTLEQLGLVPFVVAMLSIGAIGVCLWKLGG